MQDLMSQMDQCIADNWCVDNGEVCYDDCAKQTYGGSYTVGLAQVSADVENPLRPPQVKTYMTMLLKVPF